MKNLMKSANRFFMSKEIEFRVRLFNIMAVAGILISIIICIFSTINGSGTVLAIVNGVSAVVGTVLMIYVTKTNHYVVGYLCTIFFVFVILFTLLFLSGGAYKSGMPSFFIFAVIFTVFMLEGKLVYIMVIAELIYYSALCMFAYYHPDMVQFYATEQEVVTDTIIGFVVVSIALGITMHAQLNLYTKQQLKLEEEREKAELERKAAEVSRKEAEKANEAKSIFLANMSHEIRTPINVILGMNEMVIQEEKSPQITEYARKIQGAGELLTSLVNNVLDISKIESGKMEIVKEDYDLISLIRELYLVGFERTKKKGLEFVIKIDPMLPKRLHGDLLHIKQIALNFISNAVKYTKHGSVTLCLKKAAYQDSVLSLYLAVSDTGVGISEESKGTIFEEFTRADLLKHRNIEGTGLGLSIAKKLTESMGGSIHVESEYEKGSTFSVLLPQQVVDEKCIEDFSPDWITTKKEQNLQFVAPRGKLLVVDDNRENLAVIKALLAKTQIEIDTAGDGFEAIQMVKQNSIISSLWII